MAKKKSMQENVADPPKNVLYVVLHGLICLIDDKAYNFVADLVDMGNDHEYLCGDFLFEYPIPSGEDLTLEGVKKREASGKENQLDAELNAVVRLKDEPGLDNYYHSRINLPRPSKIHYYIKGKVVSDSLKGPLGDLVGTPKKISGIRVFEYSFEDYNDVHIVTKAGEMFWKCPEPVLVKDKASGTLLKAAVLHIYNEPGEVMSNAAKHNRDEFNFTFAHLGTQLRITTPAMKPEENSDPPLGIIREELYSLDMREEMLQKLMAMVRKLRYPAQVATVELDFAPGRLKQDEEPGLLGGAGGTQVCGGPNGLIGG